MAVADQQGRCGNCEGSLEDEDLSFKPLGDFGRRLRFGDDDHAFPDHPFLHLLERKADRLTGFGRWNRGAFTMNTLDRRVDPSAERVWPYENWITCSDRATVDDPVDNYSSVRDAPYFGDRVLYRVSGWY